MHTCSVARAGQEYAGWIHRCDLVGEAVHDEVALTCAGVSSYHDPPVESRGQYRGRPSDAC